MLRDSLKLDTSLYNSDQQPRRYPLKKQTIKEIQAANGKIADEALRRVRESKKEKK
jgi:hypothetical protein